MRKKGRRRRVTEMREGQRERTRKLGREKDIFEVKDSDCGEMEEIELNQERKRLIGKYRNR